MNINEIVIPCPLEIPYYTSKKTGKHSMFRMNLNQYRNAKWPVVAQAKKAYHNWIECYMKVTYGNLPRMERAAIEFSLFKRDKRKIDRANVCCMVEKFACDAFTEMGLWEDDNDEVIASTLYHTGGIDKGNPRCEMTIRKLK